MNPKENPERIKQLLCNPETIMIKGTSENILCDKCRTILNAKEHIVFVSEKGTFHYCNNKKCLPAKIRK